MVRGLWEPDGTSHDDNKIIYYFIKIEGVVARDSRCSQYLYEQSIILSFWEGRLIKGFIHSCCSRIKEAYSSSAKHAWYSSKSSYSTRSKNQDFTCPPLVD